MTVIKETNVIEGTPVSAWYVWHNGRLAGQFHSEQDAIAYAMSILTMLCIKSGTPLDQSRLKEAITFEEGTSFAKNV